MNARRYHRLAAPAARQPIAAIALAVAIVVPGATGAQQAQVAAAAGAEIPDNVINRILVKVNGEPILLSDLRRLEAERLALLREQFPEEEIAAQLPMLREQWLLGMIDEKIMLQRAEKMGIQIDANQVDRYIQGLREQNGFATDDEFAAALRSLGVTIDELRENARNVLRQQQLVFNEVQRQIFVSEQEIRDYYAEHRDEFTAPEEVRLEQVVFLGGPELADQARAAAAELQGGADPAEVGQRYVNARFVEATGGFIAVHDLTQGLAEAVPTAPDGRFSDPTRTSFGYSVFRVLERTRQEIAEMDAVRDDIRSRLTTEKSQSRLEEYTLDLRGQGHLEVFDEQFAALRERWDRRPAEAEESPDR